MVAMKYTVREASTCTVEETGQRQASLGALLQQRCIGKFRFAEKWIIRSTD
jgi:hypothetical protein